MSPVRILANYAEQSAIADEMMTSLNERLDSHIDELRTKGWKVERTDCEIILTSPGFGDRP